MPLHCSALSSHLICITCRCHVPNHCLYMIHISPRFARVRLRLCIYMLLRYPGTVPDCFYHTRVGTQVLPECLYIPYYCRCIYSGVPRYRTWSFWYPGTPRVYSVLYHTQHTLATLCIECWFTDRAYVFLRYRATWWKYPGGDGLTWLTHFTDLIDLIGWCDYTGVD